MPINNWFSFNTGVEGVVFGSFPIPNPDAIAEFKIQTSSYDAGYGRNPGSNVNVITKSGHQQFHGAAFEFFRNTVLNANDWFLSTANSPRAAEYEPVINSNVYGGAFGGPIKKDKLFFFLSYQETTRKTGFLDTARPARTCRQFLREIAAPAPWVFRIRQLAAMRRRRPSSRIRDKHEPTGLPQCRQERFQCFHDRQHQRACPWPGRHHHRRSLAL